MYFVIGTAWDSQEVGGLAGMISLILKIPFGKISHLNKIYLKHIDIKQ